jgi:hypothetical protein
MKIFLKCFIYYAFLLCSVLALAQTSGTNVHLSESHKDADFDSAFGTDQWSGRYWDKDYLVTYKLHPTSKTFAAALYDADGRMKVGAVMPMGSAKEISIFGAAVSMDGNLLIGGSFVAADGAIADFIAQANENGEITKIVRTTPQSATFICASGDHVWMYGLDRQRYYTTPTSFPVLYEFSFEKGLLYSTLDKKTLSDLWLGHHVGDVALRCNESKVILLEVPTNELIQLDVATKQLTRSKFAPLGDDATITGLALTDSNEVFVSVRMLKDKTLGVGLFHFEAQPEGKGRWVPVPETLGSAKDANAPFTALLGSQNNELVYFKKLRPNARVSWSRVDVTGK